ncbi:MAG: DtxR family transcriptional regulator, Mn-dependent transcriptional regulator [Actinomycetota bacterium]|jgi:DtxR family Mn-dependent transcriptional regulator|nr:DtxR family transcriptional regulator, Mn-dependent transcriptional regulator [Actinomycetota bacterium]
MNEPHASDAPASDAHASGPRSEIVDHYLETIFYIANEGDPVRPGRIAAWLGVSPPTVSVTLHRLEDEGWIHVASDRSVSLTAAGAEVARQVVRTHRLAERWLTDVLGLDWTTADLEAQRLAPGLSTVVTDRLDEVMGRPDTCPHGNVIPGRESPYGTLIPLSDLRPGVTAVVRRISEVAEHDAPQLLRQLDELELYPGVAVALTSDDQGIDALHIQTGDRVIALGTEVAHFIWIELQP